MRIGILTFHYAHNYGAVLQAYALKKYLISLGHNVKIVDYHNEAIASNYTKKLKSNIPLCKLRHKSMIKREFGFLRNRRYASKHWAKQWERFEVFISENLTDTPIIKEPKNLNGMFDMLIVGSDQVWSSSLIGHLDRTYLLDFPFDGKRVSYAASISEGVIPEKEKDVFFQCLKRFSAVSVREQTLADFIHRELDIQAKAVLDPSLLLPAQDYIGLSRKSQFKSNGKPFLFAYYVIEDEQMHETAKKLSDKLGLQIIEMHYYMKKEFDGSFQRADFGPYEFLYLIRNADLVLTNSFHGTVFSILFERPFFSFYQKNVRIQDLLDALELPQRHISSPELSEQAVEIDYPSVMKKLNKYREASYDFLKKALE